MQEHEITNEAHELPNFISILKNLFPDAGWVHFLHHWENVIFSSITAIFIGTFFILAAKKNSRVPEGIQNFCEAIVEGVEGFVTGILGEQGSEHVPYLGTVFLYILLMNWSGLVPFLKAPTSAWNTTIALALTTVCYVQLTGIQKQGFFNYIKHLSGNPTTLMGLLMIPLMLTINLCIEFMAVPVSLSLRLFANISSEDRLLYEFAKLNVHMSPLFFPFQILANTLSIVFGIIQAFVFMLLSTVYLALILPHENHEHEVSHVH